MILLLLITNLYNINVDDVTTGVNSAIRITTVVKVDDSDDTYKLDLDTNITVTDNTTRKFIKIV